MDATNAATPRALGFSMPAEWERHDATWLTWPRPEGISFPDAFENVPAIWANLARLLAEGEQVHINVFSPDHEKDIRAALKKADAPLDTRIRPASIFPPTSPGAATMGRSSSARDEELARWSIGDYNAWGGKYPPCDLDDDGAAGASQNWLGLPPPLGAGIVPGGRSSFDVDGEGTLLTTESCLLHPNRNPHLSRAEIEQLSARLPRRGPGSSGWGTASSGDDTDGHVDDLTRFVAPRHAW